MRRCRFVLKIVYCLFLFFYFVAFSSAEDVEVKLTTNNGNTKFAIQDSDGANVATVDSDGNAIFNKVMVGTNTTNATLEVAGNSDQFVIREKDGPADEKLWLFKADSGNLDIIMPDDGWTTWPVALEITRTGTTIDGFKTYGNFYIGGNTSRYIYDDSTNYATRFSSHVVIDGTLYASRGAVTYLTLWKGEGGAYGMSNTSGQDLSNCYLAFDPAWLSYNGKVEVKLMIYVESQGGTYNFQLHNTTDNTYPIVNSDSNMSGTATGWIESPWKTMDDGTGLKNLQLFGWVDAGTTNFRPAVLVIRAKL